MLVEEMKIGNVRVKIYDDYVVSDEKKVEAILKQIGVLAYNQIKKENGWGKTTLSIFLKAMFYGMSASRDNIKMERKKYFPWQGGIYGGSVDLSTEQGEYRIIRQFGKTPESDSINLIDLKANKELELPKIELGDYFFGVGKDTFEMTAFLPQLKFTSSGSDNISASVLGMGVALITSV